MSQDNSYIRSDNGALINLDMAKYYEIVKKRTDAENEKKSLQRIQTLEQEIEKLKGLLLKVIND